MKNRTGRGTGIIKEGVEVDIVLGYTSEHKPTMGLYHKGNFVIRIDFTEDEIERMRVYAIVHQSNRRK